MGVGPFSTSEVEQKLREHHERELTCGFGNMDHKVLNWRGRALGFEYWGYFVRLEAGWYQAVEDVCEYCLYHVVLDHGSHEEREKWRAANAALQIEEPYDRFSFHAINQERYPMPVTNKEWARFKHSERKKRKKRRLALQKRLSTPSARRWYKMTSKG